MSLADEITLDHLPLTPGVKYETSSGHWVELEQNLSATKLYPFRVKHSNHKDYLHNTYTSIGEGLRGCKTHSDIIGIYREGKKEKEKPKEIVTKAFSRNTDNWTLRTLRGMYANAINIQDKYGKELMPGHVVAELGCAINSLVFVLHPELEKLIGPDDFKIINGREWRKDRHWVWYSTKVPREVKINCV